MRTGLARSDGLERTEVTNRCALPIALTDEAQADLADSAAATRHDWIGNAGRPNRSATSGAYRRTADFRVSTTDPDATPMPLGDGGTHLGYQDHYVVDGGRARIILAALVTPAEVQENQPALDLLWRARFRWKLRPRQMTGDTKYGTVENIVAIEQEGIRAYFPLSEVGHRAGPVPGAGFRLRRGRGYLPLSGRADTCASSPNASARTAASTKHQQRPA